MGNGGDAQRLSPPSRPSLGDPRGARSEPPPKNAHWRLQGKFPRPGAGVARDGQPSAHTWSVPRPAPRAPRGGKGSARVRVQGAAQLRPLSISELGLAQACGPRAERVCPGASSPWIARAPTWGATAGGSLGAEPSHPARAHSLTAHSLARSPRAVAAALRSAPLAGRSETGAGTRPESDASARPGQSGAARGAPRGGGAAAWKGAAPGGWGVVGKRSFAGAGRARGSPGAQPSHATRRTGWARPGDRRGSPCTPGTRWRVGLRVADLGSRSPRGVDVESLTVAGAAWRPPSGARSSVPDRGGSLRSSSSWKVQPGAENHPALGPPEVHLFPVSSIYFHPPPLG